MGLSGMPYLHKGSCSQEAGNPKDCKLTDGYLASNDFKLPTKSDTDTTV